MLAEISSDLDGIVPSSSYLTVHRTMAPAAATPESKKRPRHRIDDAGDHDELSAKKPRLATTTSATSANNEKTTPSSLRSLSSAISGAFGFGRHKVTTNGSVKKGRDPIDKTWEIPDSGGEEVVKEKKQAGKPQSQSMATESPVKNKSGDLGGVYDFPGSDEEPEIAKTPSRRGRGAQSSATRASTTSKSTPIKSRKVAQSPGSKRGGRSASTKKNISDNQADKDNENSHTPEVSSSEDELTPAPARSINKVRGATGTDTDGGTPKLKGILTPSRRLSTRNNKSVAFDEGESKTDEVYFADLPSKANKTKQSQQKVQPSTGDKENSRPMKKAVVEEDEVQEEEEDDEVCAICSKPDSKPPNEILFCDSCDMAVHQRCYGVARIPKGDWLCKGCSQDPSNGAGTAERKATVVAAEVAPDIPNFEQHLRALQRVLLDRCTGRRRIRLHDQDEAYDKTFQLVEQTVLAGEGNSMLVIGARGCGKTTVSYGTSSVFHVGPMLTSKYRWWNQRSLISVENTGTNSMLYDLMDSSTPTTSSRLRIFGVSLGRKWRSKTT